eukprot:PhF_6_TR27136/c1_g1_i1/m.39601
MSVSSHRSEFFSFVEHVRNHVGKEIVVGWLHEALDAVRRGERVSESGHEYLCSLCRGGRTHSPPPPPTLDETLRGGTKPLPQQQQQIHGGMSTPTGPPNIPPIQNIVSSLISGKDMTPRQSRSRSQVSVVSYANTPTQSLTPRQISNSSRHRTQTMVVHAPAQLVRQHGASSGSHSNSRVVGNTSRSGGGNGVVSSAEAVFADLTTWYRVWHDKIAAGTRLLSSTSPTWTVRLSLIIEMQDLLEKGLIRLQSQTMSTTEPIYNSFKRLLPLLAIQIQDVAHQQVVSASAHVLCLSATVLGPFFVGFFPTVMALLPTLEPTMSHNTVMNIIKATQSETIMAYLQDHKYRRTYGDYYLAVLCIVVENVHRVITIHDNTGNAIHTVRLVNGQQLSALQQCFPGCAVSPTPLVHVTPHPLDPYYDCLSDYVQHYLDPKEETGIGHLLFWPFYICAPQIATVLFNNSPSEVRRSLCGNIPDNWDFVIHTGLLLSNNAGKDTLMSRPILSSSLFQMSQGQPGSVVRTQIHSPAAHIPGGVGVHMTPPRSRSLSPRNARSLGGSTQTTGTFVWRQVN